MKNVLKFGMLAVLLAGTMFFCLMERGEQSLSRVLLARNRVWPVLSSLLSIHDAQVGDPVFLRAVKEDSVLELWVKPHLRDRFVLVKRYPIAAWSGVLGPKEKEGDGQTPEGFYEVPLSALNPQSKYHLSFNIGYPNAYDRSLNRTGSFIMVHGKDVSIGCLAMTDPGIEEIYTMVEQALSHGQKCVPVQIYPFVPTQERLQKEVDSPYFPFWSVLAQAWYWTERYHLPAQVRLVNGRLVVSE